MLTTYSNISGLTLSGKTIVGEVRLENCSGLVLDGMTFVGSGESGPTVRIRGCNGFRITRCTFKDTAEDHLYIYDGSSYGEIEQSAFTIAGRNAISIINGHSIRIKGNRFDGAHGTRPEACIDIEANTEDPDGCNHDIQIICNRFANAATGALVVATRNPRNVTVDSNRFDGCYVAVNASGNGHIVTNNRIRNAASIAIGVTGDMSRIDGNDISDKSNLPGIYVEGAEHLIRFNRISGRLGEKGAIRSVRGDGGTVIYDNDLGGGKVTSHPMDIVA